MTIPREDGPKEHGLKKHGPKEHGPKEHGMERFRGIEGARGWLAWTVVLSHLVVATGLAAGMPRFWALAEAGGHAVSVFIIISGFVITHLLLSDPQPYRTYIARRWFRIYPVYAVCLVLGLIVDLILVHAGPANPWLDVETTQHYAHQVREISEGRLPLHLLAHLTLLHGVISNGVLDEAQYMFLGPSWSLSLEWQFYLVAPLAVAALRKPGWNILAVLVIGAGIFAFQHGVFGRFYTPSILPAAGAPFAIGISMRLWIDRLPRIGALTLAAAILGLTVFAFLVQGTAYLVGAVILFGYIQLTPAALARRGMLVRVLQAGLDSRFANAAGRRSYAVYLLHAPVVAVTSYFGYAVLELGRMPLFLFTAVVAVAITAAGSELLHRLVERPGIALGRRLTARRVPALPSAVELSQG